MYEAAQLHARLCENPPFWPFRRCKLLISFDGIFEKSTFYTVSRSSRPGARVARPPAADRDR